MFRAYSKLSWKPLLLVGLALTFQSWALSQAETTKENSEDSSVTEITFTGTGRMETKRFTVEDGWKLQWKTESPIFKLSAHGSARRPYIGQRSEREKVLQWFEVLEPIVLANTTNQHGTAVHPLGGTFYLKVVATGPWHIVLRTFKDTKDYLDVPYTGAP